MSSIKLITDLKLDISFLETCHLNHVIPKFLSFRLYKRSLEDTSLYRNWQERLLSLEISSKKSTLAEYNELLSSAKADLRTSLSFLDFHAAIYFLNRRHEKKFKSIAQRPDRKLESLGASRSVQSLDPDNVIFNLSNYVLSNREKFLLSFGLNFGLPVTKPNFYKHFLPFENLILRLKNIPLIPSASFNTTIRLVKQAAYDAYNKANKSPTFNIFKPHDRKILQNLSKNEDIIVSRPDKGRGVVIQNKNDYIQKMNCILSDSTKFSHCTTQDPYKLSLTKEDKILRFLRSLKKKGAISQFQYDQLHPVGSGPGLLYGLPKVHKQGNPLRPILAAYNTPSYNIAKFLVPLLEPLTKSPYTVTNSY